MCGIFGCIIGDEAHINTSEIINGINRLFILSETRGKEASGLCYLDSKREVIIKDNVRAKKLIESEKYLELTQKIASGSLIMGHARMVTNGSSECYENNQPIVKGDLTCIHNGIIVNDNDVWNKYNDLKREYEVDTEVLLALLQKYDYQDNFLYAFDKSLKEIKGSVSIALIDKKSNYVFLYSNTGSLYYINSLDKNFILFASERYILESMILTTKFGKKFSKNAIKKIVPLSGKIIDIKKSKITKQDLFTEIKKGEIERELVLEGKRKENSAIIINKIPVNELEKQLFVDVKKIRKLRRCTRCILPETFPGIEFNESGECNICRTYKKNEIRKEDELIQYIKSGKNKEYNYDAIVPLSGGRDSCYMIHYLKKEMGLHPVAYTYDWGMVTDLARRNIQRMCGELQIEHILISADINEKRKNIQKNVNAWLKNPSLATVPLFMAGDKQFFYYAQLLKRQMHVNSVVFGMNRLEETKFKVGFAGMKENGNNGLHYDLSSQNKMRLAFTYGKEFLKNPSFINKSIFDTLYGFASYYLIPKDYMQFFDYVQWNQKDIENVIINNYGWETSTETNETWRIGDGTAPFYNYIYYKLAGFTEFDTFKSNQIREGLLSRDDAINDIEKSNQTPVNAFLWYCNTINNDALETVKIINSTKTLYDIILEKKDEK